MPQKMSDMTETVEAKIQVKEVILQEIYRRVKESINPHVVFCESIVEMRKEANDIREKSLLFCEHELLKMLNKEDRNE